MQDEPRRRLFWRIVVTNFVSLTDLSGAPVSVLTGRTLDSHLASIDLLGNATFSMDNSLNSKIALTDGSGAIIQKLFYEPYGATTGGSDGEFPFAYTGRVPIVDGFYYNRDRIYEAANGRFLSEDPTGLLGGINQYVYANDNPSDFSDPTGDAANNLVDMGVGMLSGGGFAAIDCDNGGLDLATAAAVGLGAAAVITLLPEELSVGAVIGISSLISGSADAIGQYAHMGFNYLQGKDPGEFNRGEYIGALIGGGLAGGYGKILYEGGIAAFGKLGSSLFANANTSVFGLFPFLGKKIDNTISGNQESPCGCH